MEILNFMNQNKDKPKVNDIKLPGYVFDTNEFNYNDELTSEVQTMGEQIESTE